ncbi:TIGR04086 family membrane protein, partial [Caldibacillus debilis]|uniref:TIGR04086 family membrane protein n=1 Tax=Caldibacillus debilis TaxID=301148 RepID=UPI0023F44F91
MKMMRSVFYGLLTIYLIAALFSLIFSLLLSFTSLHESSLEGVVTAFSFLLLFIGGFFAGGKGK